MYRAFCKKNNKKSGKAGHSILFVGVTSPRVPILSNCCCLRVVRALLFFFTYKLKVNSFMLNIYIIIICISCFLVFFYSLSIFLSIV
ncbi:hypothetical protein BDC45DRAFT_192865 [Circinella umbellata]|nr:hypothetical protein BDC45DRAFT_192865 [Circinella umbellata]